MSEITKCERCREYNAAAVDFRNQAANAQADLAALRARHNALKEAVAWYIECEAFYEFGYQSKAVAEYAVFITLNAARAEVARLLSEES